MSPAVSCSVLDSLQRSYDWRDSAGDSLGDTISYFALQQLPAALQDLQQTAAGSREQREGSLRATRESERTLGQLNINAVDLLPLVSWGDNLFFGFFICTLIMTLIRFLWMIEKQISTKSSGHGLVPLWQCTRQRGWIRSQILNNQFRERERESWINVLCCDGIFSFIQLQFL